MGKKFLKEAYITRVLAPIEDADAQEEMALELSVHIDERIEFYKEIGYDDKTAEKKAVEDMGDPEPVGESLSRLYPKEWVGLAVLALLPLPFVPLLLFLLMLFFSIDDGLFPAILEAPLLIYWRFRDTVKNAAIAFCVRRRSAHLSFPAVGRWFKGQAAIVRRS